MYTMIDKIDLLKKFVDQKRWFVLYTRPNFEKMITRKLIELGFHSYLPLQKELRQWNDRKVWIETPLFKSYIFIKTNLKKKDLVFNINGILRYVSFGSQLAVLSEKEIERIKQLCSYQGRIDIEFENLPAGIKVEISDGILKGLEGYLIDNCENKKIRIRIDGLNCFACVTAFTDSISFKNIS